MQNSIQWTAESIAVVAPNAITATTMNIQPYPDLFFGQDKLHLHVQH